jgi:hypothetical protein
MTQGIFLARKNFELNNKIKKLILKIEHINSILHLTF